MYNINKSLQYYIEQNKEVPDEETKPEEIKKPRKIVDIQQAMKEIDESIVRMNRLVSKDLESIARLDSKIHSF
jgi:hypothetical protein